MFSKLIWPITPFKELDLRSFIIIPDELSLCEVLEKENVEVDCAMFAQLYLHCKYPKYPAIIQAGGTPSHPDLRYISISKDFQRLNTSKIPFNNRGQWIVKYDTEANEEKWIGMTEKGIVIDSIDNWVSRIFDNMKEECINHPVRYVILREHIKILDDMCEWRVYKWQETDLVPEEKVWSFPSLQKNDEFLKNVNGSMRKSLSQRLAAY